MGKVKVCSSPNSLMTHKNEKNKLIYKINLNKLQKFMKNKPYLTIAHLRHPFVCDITEHRLLHLYCGMNDKQNLSLLQSQINV